MKSISQEVLLLVHNTPVVLKTTVMKMKDEEQRLNVQELRET